MKGNKKTYKTYKTYLRQLKKKIQRKIIIEIKSNYLKMIYEIDEK